MARLHWTRVRRLTNSAAQQPTLDNHPHDMTMFATVDGWVGCNSTNGRLPRTSTCTTLGGFSNLLVPRLLDNLFGGPATGAKLDINGIRPYRCQPGHQRATNQVWPTPYSSFWVGSGGRWSRSVPRRVPFCCSRAGATVLSAQ